MPFRCLAARCRKAGVAARAYCLMPDHVHLILAPATADGLALALGETQPVARRAD
ncbi:MAG: hypothetical protein ABSC37_22245 [Xanthobacteraceae bacterium]